MNIKNYTLLSSEYIEDLQSEALYLEHNKTRARVLLLKNSNHNKTFSIGFKTPPVDSTGVAHIVEHSTLSGSRKYKTREPFMDMVSSSLQTFLNAMTYPDKTIYPISSRNDKDFQQLMDVYLDSVFYPRMNEVKEIFLQEGWHKEIHEDKLLYNGVVYNEMKGVYSDPSNQVSDIVREKLHPSGTYHHDSGGNPKNIPDLTYEDFLDFHRKYYHPSNSYILLAGDLDFEEKLAYLDQEYLSHFDYLEPKSEIIGHPAYKEALEFSETYSTSKEEYSENNSFLAMAWNIKTDPSPRDLLLRSFFADLLIESDNALLKNKLLEKGIGEDIYSELSTSNTLDFTILAYHAHKDQYQAFKDTLLGGIEDLVREGIPKRDLEATLNKFEFSVRQGGGSHRDLITYIGALSTWLYGQDPIEALKMSDHLKDMREALHTDFYEKTLDQWFLQGKNRVQGYIEGEVGKREKEEAVLEEKLKTEFQALSNQEKEAILKVQEDLVSFQMSEDSPQAKATIPKLEISDIPREISLIPREELSLAGLRGTFNSTPANGIIYTALAFPMDHLSLEEMVDASILSDLLGRLATKNYSRDQLAQETYLQTGGIVFETPIEVHADYESYTPFLFIRTASLAEKIDHGLDLLREILFQTKFSDRKHIEEILYASKSDMESSILQSAHTLAMARVKSYFHKPSYVDEEINGLELYFTLAKLLKEFDYSHFVERMEAVYKKVFTSKETKFNIRCEEKHLEKAKSSLESFLNHLEKKDLPKAQIDFKVQAKNEAFISSSMVNYVAKGYNLKLLGQEYQGHMAVLANVLSTKYLHYNIRAKGGAYGAGIQFSRSNLAATYSYRDPNLDKTIQVYDTIGDFLKDLELSQRDLTDFIIGSMNSFDPHMAPEALGLVDFKRYLNGLTRDQVLQWKNQALSTDLDTLKSKADLLDKVMKENYLCVIGNEEMIRDKKDLFHAIKNLKQ